MHEEAASAPVAVSTSTSSTTSATGIMNRPHGLPQTLMKLLMDDSVPEAIWWLPGGKEFAIDAEKFPTQVLEVYFPDCKYASFIRRVHKMGFSRETRTLKKVYGAQIPAHAVAFRHPKFTRDNPEMAREIKQGPGKTTKAKQARGGTSPMSSRSSSPRNLQVESTGFSPAAARAELLPTALTANALAVNALVAPSVSASNASFLQQFTGHSFDDAQEEKESSLHNYESVPRVAEAVAAPSILDNATILQYIQSLQRQRDQEEQLQRRVEELRQERQIRSLLEEHQSRQQAAVRQQLLAAALMNTNTNTSATSASSISASNIQTLQQLLSNSISPVSLLSSSAPANSTSSNNNNNSTTSSLSLELLRRLQQESGATAASNNGHSTSSLSLELLRRLQQGDAPSINSNNSHHH